MPQWPAGKTLTCLIILGVSLVWIQFRVNIVCMPKLCAHRTTSIPDYWQTYRLRVNANGGWAFSSQCQLLFLPNVCLINNNALTALAQDKHLGAVLLFPAGTYFYIFKQVLASLWADGRILIHLGLNAAWCISLLAVRVWRHPSFNRGGKWHTQSVYTYPVTLHTHI